MMETLAFNELSYNLAGDNSNIFIKNFLKYFVSVSNIMHKIV